MLDIQFNAWGLVGLLCTIILYMAVHIYKMMDRIELLQAMAKTKYKKLYGIEDD